MPTNTGLPSPQDAPQVTSLDGRKFFVPSDTPGDPEGNIFLDDLMREGEKYVVNNLSSLTSNNVAIVYIGTGQSNMEGAANSGVVPANGTLPNVEFVRAGESVFKSHVAGNTNANRTTGSNDYSISLAFAKKW